ncbi:hypothetical protein [Aurantimicrobium minutum]|uniref:hypothetical protein n=1 Tax=Aurantimicrobium minutum TaxID=708131 RepID=UPI0024768E86|nr:hypothetical protein [Aurantimicrobium minutum]MDH6536236.1 putative membrane protein YccC [Aurantimicrobium minutum]
MSEIAPQRPLRTRLLLSAGGFLLGLFVGSVTTVVHQSVITIAEVDMPWGLILGVLVVTGFLVGLRIVVQDRLVVLVAALGLVAMVFMLSQASTGGSVLIPNNLWGTIWAIAPTLIATIVVAWPRLPQRHRGANNGTAVTA